MPSSPATTQLNRPANGKTTGTSSWAKAAPTGRMASPVQHESSQPGATLGRRTLESTPKSAAKASPSGANSKHGSAEAARYSAYVEDIDAGYYGGGGTKQPPRNHSTAGSSSGNRHGASPSGHYTSDAVALSLAPGYATSISSPARREFLRGRREPAAPLSRNDAAFQLAAQVRQSVAAGTPGSGSKSRHATDYGYSTSTAFVSSPDSAPPVFGGRASYAASGADNDQAAAASSATSSNANLVVSPLGSDQHTIDFEEQRQEHAGNSAASAAAASVVAEDLARLKLIEKREQYAKELEEQMELQVAARKAEKAARLAPGWSASASAASMSLGPVHWSPSGGSAAPSPPLHLSTRQMGASISAIAGGISQSPRSPLPSTSNFTTGNGYLDGTDGIASITGLGGGSGSGGLQGGGGEPIRRVMPLVDVDSGSAAAGMGSTVTDLRDVLPHRNLDGSPAKRRLQQASRTAQLQQQQRDAEHVEMASPADAIRAGKLSTSPAMASVGLPGHNSDHHHHLHQMARSDIAGDEQEVESVGGRFQSHRLPPMSPVSSPPRPTTNHSAASAFAPTSSPIRDTTPAPTATFSSTGTGVHNYSPRWMREAATAVAAGHTLDGGYNDAGDDSTARALQFGNPHSRQSYPHSSSQIGAAEQRIPTSEQPTNGGTYRNPLQHHQQQQMTEDEAEALRSRLDRVTAKLAAAVDVLEGYQHTFGPLPDAVQASLSPRRR